jgi:molybdopterin-guanine dinucleotide biosynthesis protein MobB
MAKAAPICVGICGYKKSGKTTLIEQLLDVLMAEGLSVGVIKHHNEPVEADIPGTDTHRFFQAGADVIGYDGRSLFLRRHQAEGFSLDQELALFGKKTDLVLVEGFKESAIPKIWLLREGETEAPATVEKVLAALDESEERLPKALEVIRECMKNSSSQL